MSSGPEPHSVEYDDIKFLRIVEYFDKNPKIRQLNTYESPEYLSDSILQLIKELEIREFRRIDQSLVFICGYGLLGNCWGFIHGDFASHEHEEVEEFTIGDDKNRLTIIYLERLSGFSYRFAGK